MIGLFITYMEELTHLKHKLFWTHQSEISGIKYKDSKSDAIFKLGKPSHCNEEETGCIWSYKDSYDDKEIVVRFENNKVDLIVHIDDIFWDIPFRKDVDLMHYIVGKEDILSVSVDMLTRKYTYAEQGISYVFKNNQLGEVLLGNVTWRQNIGTGISEYYIDGNLVCPSERCPFDMDTGEVNPEFIDKSYRDFL